jgi:predicted glycoside hydrolase/deacetylase ChbG (UPF0249 family)
MVKIIINADDLGYSSVRDRGIFECFKAGAITCASLIVNGPSAETAAKQAVDMGLPLGLHLNLTEGKPLSTSPSLCDDQGNMFYKMLKLKKNMTDKEIIRECTAQLDRFRQLTGAYPIHVDGHQHVHILNGVPELIAPVLQRIGVRSVRIPDEDVSNMDWVSTERKKRYEDRFTMAVRARLIFRQYDILAPECFIGVGLCSTDMSQEHLNHCLSGTFGVVELMCHPGYGSTDTSERVFNDEFSRSSGRLYECRQLQQLTMKHAKTDWSYYLKL